MRTDRTVALIGAPTDIGAGHRGGSMGPEALRVAGIEQALRGLGEVCDDRTRTGRATRARGQHQT